MKLTLSTLVMGMACALFGESAWSDRKDDGREAYEASCAQCHRTGVDGAPVTGNPEDWANRSHLWEAVLSEHANSGFFGMPAKGGEKQLSEYDVDVAVEYMLNITHPDLPRD